MADEYHAQDGQRYYVVAGATDGRLLVIDRSRLRELKKAKRIDYSITVKSLEEKCFYHTPYANGDGQLTKEDIAIKREDFFNWREACYDRSAKIKALKKKKGA